MAGIADLQALVHLLEELPANYAGEVEAGIVEVAVDHHTFDQLRDMESRPGRGAPNKTSDPDVIRFHGVHVRRSIGEQPRLVVYPNEGRG